MKLSAVSLVSHYVPLLQEQDLPPREKKVRSLMQRLAGQAEARLASGHYRKGSRVYPLRRGQEKSLVETIERAASWNKRASHRQTKRRGLATCSTLARGAALLLPSVGALATTVQVASELARANLRIEDHMAEQPRHHIASQALFGGVRYEVQRQVKRALTSWTGVPGCFYNWCVIGAKAAYRSIADCVKKKALAC